MSAPRQPRGGFAMVIVLLTLMALLVLCTPFLMTVRNADQASAQFSDRQSLELVLDGAERLADARLGASHPALDSTPYYDSLDELHVDNDFADKAFLDPSDPKGAMFDLDVHDVSGRIDLNSAPPQVIANLIGGAALTVGSVEPDATEIHVSSTAGFLPKGFFWLHGELIGYTGLTSNAFTGCVRGLGAELGSDGKPSECGPRPAHAVDANTVIVDQRAYALVQWRAWTPDAELRTFDAIEEVRAATSLIMAESLGDAAYDALEQAGTVYAGVGADPVWQHGARIRNKLRRNEDCALRLEGARWFNEGTTVRITDGSSTELGIVRGAGNGNTVILMQPVANDYEAFRAVVEPLARRPVNVNTAPAEVLRALFLNLQLRGRQSRITPTEADALCEVALEARPFTSFEDFERRLVLPAAGWEPYPSDAKVVPKRFQTAPASGGSGGASAPAGFIDEDDARALYKNALNASDVELAFSTMPFAFTSTDTHALQLRAAINAESGVERARGVRDEVKLVVPQRDLLYLATRQEDFEELFRLDCDGAGWATGPHATSRFDPSYGSSPPTRARAHLGVYDTAPSDDPLTPGHDFVFAARDEDKEAGFAEPWCARVAETGKKVGRMLHFDDETKHLDGRYLPDERVMQAANDAVVNWVSAAGLQRPLTFSMWIKPEELEQGALLLDAGGPYSDSDRISLTIDDGYLVLRVLDGAGDHPDTSFEEVAEARYELVQGNGPGMPLDTWIHVSADVRGNRPDQITLLVDGKWTSEVRGLTRLTGSIGSDTATIPVESTDGFPSPCVLRIGNELIEATVAGATSFSAAYTSTGANAGFGGRLAREKFYGVEPNEIPEALALGPVAYASGTPVALYGYALTIEGNIQPGQMALASDLGPFAVGQVIGMEEEGGSPGAEEIVVELAGGLLYTLGTGLETQTTAELELAPVEAGTTVEELMTAFDKTGGYAVLMSITPDLTIVTIAGPSTPELTSDNVRIGGIEVVHYTGWDGSLLHVDRRGDAIQLPDLTGAPPELAGKGAFVFDWNDGLLTDGGLGPTPDERLSFHTKILPISLGATNAGAFKEQINGWQNPRLAQITRDGQESGLTEWVRYDYIANDRDLVRDNPVDLVDLWEIVQGGITTESTEGEVDPGGGSGGTGSHGDSPGPPPAALYQPEPPPGPATPPPVDGANWHYRMGDEENADLVLTRAVRTHFQFRGVFGTFDHAQPQGAVVLPVWRTVDPPMPPGQELHGADFGRPGRFDAVTFLDQTPSLPGFLGVVHHAHRPREYAVYNWQESPGDPLVPVAVGGAVSVAQPQILSTNIHVALDGPLSVPVAASTAPAAGTTPIYDSRLVTRVSKFPSGELPRGVTSVAVGGSYGSGAGVPAATVDEVLFGNSEFALNEDTHGAQLALRLPVDAGSDVLQLWPDSLRLPLGLVPFSQGGFLAAWPQDAGIVRIGDELICYQGVDPGGGTVLVAEGGRGMLGTDPQPHAAGEAVSLLESLEVGVLAKGVGAEDSAIAITASDDFPNSGLLLIEDELVHYAWLDASELGMPRASSVPGAFDGKGAGLFRGRFGTTAAGHGPNTPVVLFPFRYWDRWTPRADAPELHYLGVSLSQPAAFWRSVFWEVEPAGPGGPHLSILQRTNPAVPWDADPEEEPDLDLLTEGMPGDEPNPIGRQSDRIEWRICLEYAPGAFDPVLGMAHGWKMAPRLSFFGAQYLGPSMTLRRVAR